MCDEQAEVVSRDEVERKVRSVLKGDEGMDIVRRRARDLQMAAKKAVLPGGSSQRAISSFVDRITARCASALAMASAES